jgi:serine/threonine protein kinase
MVTIGNPPTKPYNYPFDVWSLGIILYEIFTLQKPFKIKSDEVYRAIKKGDDPKYANYSKIVSEWKRDKNRT